MAEFVLKYADPRGEIHQQVAEAGSERELRDRFSQQGFLIYSIKPRREIAGMAIGGGKKKINLEKFLIFNQQFVTLIRAGLPILKALDLLSDRLTDPKLSKYINAVREEMKNGRSLRCVRAAGRVSAHLCDLRAGGREERLAGRGAGPFHHLSETGSGGAKKLIMSLIYPCLLMVLVICLMVFLVTFVVPKFAELYSSMSAQFPAATQILIAIGTTARNYILFAFVALIALARGFRFWAKTAKGEERVDRWRLHMPVVGEIWIKYQVAQFARVLGTLLVGGFPAAGAGHGVQFAGHAVAEKQSGGGRPDGEGRAGPFGIAAKTGIFPGFPST